MVTWNGYLIDGHNRFEICTRLNIKYKVVNMPFESEEDAISWICSNQLGRRSISEETRKYLIGKDMRLRRLLVRGKAIVGSINIRPTKNVQLGDRHQMIIGTEQQTSWVRSITCHTER